MPEQKGVLSPRSSLNYTDQGQWVNIQRTTFKNWVNEQLRHVGVGVQELRTDFSDGVNLVTLVEALTGRPVSGATRKPSNQYQKLQNITVALDTVAKDGVKIVNIDSSDVAEGNIKLVLALVWLLVLRYQGGLGAAQPRKWMLAWLQAILPECQIKNFTSDWNDGLALNALLEFCKPGIAPDWRSLDKDNKLQNCRQAMELAQDHFDIPLVLRPEDLCSSQLDEKSAILYLSYFTRVGGPGYNATREKIQERLKSTKITNFTTDWNDGKALTELVTSSGGHVPDSPTRDRSPIETLHLALEAGKELGIEPLLTASEIEKEQTEHLGIMALTAQYTRINGGSPRREHVDHINTSLNGYHSDHQRLSEKVSLNDDDAYSTHTNASSMSVGGSASQATPTFQVVRKASLSSANPLHHLTHGTPLHIDIYSVGVIMESKIRGRRFDPDLFKVEAEAPSGRVIRMAGDGHYSAQFTPDEIGRWRVSMYYNNKYMDGCPVDVCDPSQVRVSNLRGGQVGKQHKFQVDCTGAGQGDLGVDISHNGKRIPTYVTETFTPRLYNVTYTPYDPGPYEVNVHFNRAEVRDSDFHSTDPEERRRQAVFKTSTELDGDVVRISASCDWEIDYVTGGPFIAHATDSSDIQVYGMKDGTVCSNPELIADCTKAGNGIITAEMTHNGSRYPCKVRTDQPGLHHISFKPRGPGTYKIWINYDGTPVKGSPFVQEIAELGQPIAYGDGLYRGMPGRSQTFTIDPRGHPGPVTAEVIGPLRNVPCHLTPQSDGTLSASYVPHETGPHSVDIRVQGKPINGGPFKPYIVDPSRVRVPGGWSTLVNEKGMIPLHVNKEKLLPFDASEAGEGQLSAEVRGPSGKIPVAIDARNDGKHTVIFTPREEGKHYIDVKWGGFALTNSPYEGYATWAPAPVISSDADSDIITLRHIPLQHSRPPQEDKDIIPLTVGQEKELTFDTADSGPGHMSAVVRGPRSQVPVAVDNRLPGKPCVLFTPREEGKHLIDVKWNGTPLSSSPFIGFASKDPHNNSLHQPSAVYLFGQPSLNKSRDEDKSIIPLKVHKENQIPFDASEAGPGRLTATVRGPTHTIRPAVEDRGDGKPVLCFTPEEEGQHYIDVSWNGTPLPQSPLLGFATRDPDQNGYPHGMPEVYLAGKHPRNKTKDEDKDIIPLKVNKETQIPFDASKAGPGRLTATVRGPTHTIRPAVEDRGDGKPVLCFTPQEEGKHHIDVSWNGTPLPQSPLLGFATRDPDQNGYPHDMPQVYLIGQHPKNGNPASVNKDIIPLTVNREKVLPFDATLAGPGQLTASVQGPSRSVPVEVKDRKNGRPVVHFTPKEEGKHNINVQWNGRPIPQSPLIGYAVPDNTDQYDGRQPVFLIGNRHSTGRPNSSEKDIIPLKVNQPKQLPFDATEAGPGIMTATVRGPTRSIPANIDDRKSTKPILHFVPEEEGKHLIDVDWNGKPVVESPLIGYATKDPEPTLLSPGSSHPSSEPDVSFRSSLASLSPHSPQRERAMPTQLRARVPAKILLTGRGLKEADLDKTAVFNVDGSEASPGKPVAHLEGIKARIPVAVETIRHQVYRCTYVPRVPGAYKLYINWNELPLRGTPFKVNVKGTKESPEQGIIYPRKDIRPVRPGEDFLLTFRHPNSSQLTVKCTDPRGRVMGCRFLDNLDGTRSLKMTPTMPGRHRVEIKYNNVHIMGSPYNVDISESHAHGTVRVWGPGIQRGGVLNRFESNFWVDATGAGAGELRVRVMGPKGAFHVKMSRSHQKDKLYQCFYDPVEPGIYTINVQWSGAHIEGSPFTVYLAQSTQELDMLSEDNRISPSSGVLNGSMHSLSHHHEFLY